MPKKTRQNDARTRAKDDHFPLRGGGPNFFGTSCLGIAFFCNCFRRCGNFVAGLRGALGRSAIGEFSSRKLGIIAVARACAECRWVVLCQSKEWGFDESAAGR